MKRKTITIASGYTLAALLVLGCFILTQYRRAEDYKRQVTDSQSRAITRLVSEIGSISSALQKCVYTGTPPMLAGMCADISGNSAAANVALGEVPLSGTEFEKTSDLISRAGNYAHILAKKAGSGEMPGDEDFINLKKLSDTASTLTKRLREFSTQLGVSAVSAPDEPFFDADRKPSLLEGTSEVSRSEAAGAAAAFMGVRQNSIKYEGMQEEPVPVYLFSQSGSGGAVRIEVTRLGGYIARTVSAHTPQTATVTQEDALAAAGALLRKNGLKDMKPVYHTTEDNTLLVNFAYNRDGVIYYPDLITVRIGLDNGAVTGFDSLQYIMNHRKRELPKPELSEENARSGVSQRLEVLSNTMAVITASDGGEVFCYEFLCKDETDRRCHVYINAHSGVEERITLASGGPLF